MYLLTALCRSPPAGLHFGTRLLTDVSVALQSAAEVRVHSLTPAQVEHAVAYKDVGVNGRLTTEEFYKIQYKGLTEDLFL